MNHEEQGAVGPFTISLIIDTRYGMKLEQIGMRNDKENSTYSHAFVGFYRALDGDVRI